MKDKTILKKIIGISSYKENGEYKMFDMYLCENTDGKFSFEPVVTARYNSTLGAASIAKLNSAIFGDKNCPKTLIELCEFIRDKYHYVTICAAK